MQVLEEQTFDYTHSWIVLIENGPFAVGVLLRMPQMVLFQIAT